MSGATVARTSVAVDMLASGRVLLNIHSGEGRSLEWPRVLAAIVNGCLVVTESSGDYGPLLPGEHLIAAPSDVLGAYAASMVTDEALRAEMAATAYEFVRTKLEFKALLEPVCALLEEASGSATRVRRPQPVGAPTPPAGPAARPPRSRPWSRRERQMHARIKELHNGESDLVQQVEALQASSSTAALTISRRRSRSPGTMRGQRSAWCSPRTTTMPRSPRPCRRS